MQQFYEHYDLVIANLYNYYICGNTFNAHALNYLRFL